MVSLTNILDIGVYDKNHEHDPILVIIFDASKFVLLTVQSSTGSVIKYYYNTASTLFSYTTGGMVIDGKDLYLTMQESNSWHLLKYNLDSESIKFTKKITSGLSTTAALVYGKDKLYIGGYYDLLV